MDLSYGSEYEQLRAEVRDFLEASWPPKGDEAEAVKVIQGIFKAGLDEIKKSAD